MLCIAGLGPLAHVASPRHLDSSSCILEPGPVLHVELISRAGAFLPRLVLQRQQRRLQEAASLLVGAFCRKGSSSSQFRLMVALREQFRGIRDIWSWDVGPMPHLNCQREQCIMAERAVETLARGKLIEIQEPDLSRVITALGVFLANPYASSRVVLLWTATQQSGFQLFLWNCALRADRDIWRRNFVSGTLSCGATYEADHVVDCHLFLPPASFQDAVIPMYLTPTRR